MTAMTALMANPLARHSLARQFLMVSFPIVLVGGLIIGHWVGQQVEVSVVRRIGGVSALFVDSFIATHVQSLVSSQGLLAVDQAALRSDFANTALGNKVLSLKIWRSDGVVLFSTYEPDQGRKFPIDEGLAIALKGDIFSEVSERTKTQQAQHGQPMPRLIETYTPVHGERNGEVLAVAEFYQAPDEVDREVLAAQQKSWLVVACTTLGMYLLLFLVVRRGSQVIESQQKELSQKVRQLTELNDQNLKLRDRIVGAAEKSTSLNEIFLRRVSADIHDGPIQDLGYALMQLKRIGEIRQSNEGMHHLGSLSDIIAVKLAVESTLSDLRAISSNLELPEIEHLSPSEIASRVVTEFEGKTGSKVQLLDLLPKITAIFRTKVTLYRVLQESLANTYRHAMAKECNVVLSANTTCLCLEVSDKGPGFDADSAAKKGRLGLRGMRQRVEVLGGVFEITSTKGTGTRIKVSMPLASSGMNDD
jgi:signal transduction histidine kinase